MRANGRPCFVLRQAVKPVGDFASSERAAMIARSSASSITTVRPPAALSSPIFWDLVVISTYLLTTAIFLYLPLIPDVALLRDRFGAKGGWRTAIYHALAVGWTGTPGQRHALERGTTAIAILIIPIAVLVRRVDLKRRLDLAGEVQRALPALVRAIQAELERIE